LSEKKDILHEISSFVINGNVAEIKQSVDNGLKMMIPAKTILDEGLLHGMGIIGRKFRDNTIYVPQVIMSARVMKTALNILKPLLVQNFLGSRGKVVIGTVAGDMHDLGKTVVSIMLEGNGFSIIDLGVDVPVHQFVSAVERVRPVILALSCMLSTTLPNMKEVVNVIKKTSFEQPPKLLIGGLPVTQKFACSIGADAFGLDANLAVIKALEIVEKQS